MSSIVVAHQKRAGIRLAIFATYLVIFLDIFAVSIFIPHLVGRFKNLNLSNASVSLILPIYGIVQIFSCPLVGFAGDLYGRKFILIGCLGVTALSYFTLGFASHWIALFAVRAIAGFFKQTQLLGKAILSDLASQSKYHDLCTVLGNSEAFGSMGFIFGPAIGSYLTSYHHTSENSFFLLCCLSSAILVLNILIVTTFISNSAKLNTIDTKTSNGAFLMTQYVDDENQNEIRKPQNYFFEKTDVVSPFNRFLVQTLNVDKSKPANSNSWLNSNDSQVSIFIAITFFFCLTIHTVRESMPIFISQKYNMSIVDYGYLISIQAIIGTFSTFISGPIISKVYGQNSRLVVVQSGILQMIAVASIYINNISYQIAWLSLSCLTIANQYLGVGIKTLALENTENLAATLGFSQTATAVGRTFASILVGLYLNNCEQILIIGCVSSFVAVLITAGFIDEKSNYERLAKEKIS